MEFDELVGRIGAAIGVELKVKVSRQINIA